MEHPDHVDLLRRGIDGPGGTWADLGAGSGAFTLALADLTGPAGEIYAVDRDPVALEANARAMQAKFPATRVHHLVADFTQPLLLPPLDGIVMANSLHFQREQRDLLRALRGYLRPGGRLLIVEYNLVRGNSAVPYPVPWDFWQALAKAAGFERTDLLARRPSRFLKEIYSAISQ